MRRNARFGLAASIAGGVVLILSGVGAQTELPASDAGWETIAEAFGGAKSETRPRRDVTMTFTFATEVKEILVKPGQRVTRDDLMARARDREAREALELARMRAENDLPVRSADKAAELATVRHTRLVEADEGRSVASPMELLEAKTEMELRDLEAQQARMSQREEGQRQAQLEASFERFQMLAPFDGIVADVLFEVGQAVRETDEGIRIVDVKTLYLDAHADTDEAFRLGLEQGHRAWVLVKVGSRPMLIDGEIVHVYPVANSVSRTVQVRVEVDNPDGWFAGTPALVHFTRPSEEWFERFGRGGGGAMHRGRATTGVSEAAASVETGS